MPVTYFNTVPSVLPPGGANYRFFGGSNLFSGTSERSVTDVWDLVYNDFSAITPPTTDAWCFGYTWNATITVALGDLSRYKMFASEPNRYSIGHICIEEKFGVVDDFTWKFELQKIGNYRAHFFQGNPNPGSLIPDFPTPVNSNLYSYFPEWSSGFNGLLSNKRANRLSLFNPLGLEYVIVVNYYAAFVFDASTIVASTPLAVLGIFP